MKKTYEAPVIEVVKFEYRDQVVAASGGCKSRHTGDDGCKEWEAVDQA